MVEFERLPIGCEGEFVLLPQGCSPHTTMEYESTPSGRRFNRHPHNFGTPEPSISQRTDLCCNAADEHSRIRSPGDISDIG